MATGVGPVGVGGGDTSELGRPQGWAWRGVWGPGGWTGSPSQRDSPPMAQKEGVVAKGWGRERPKPGAAPRRPPRPLAASPAPFPTRRAAYLSVGVRCARAGGWVRGCHVGPGAGGVPAPKRSGRSGRTVPAPGPRSCPRSELGVSPPGAAGALGVALAVSLPPLAPPHPLPPSRFPALRARGAHPLFGAGGPAPRPLSSATKFICNKRERGSSRQEGGNRSGSGSWRGGRRAGGRGAVEGIRAGLGRARCPWSPGPPGWGPGRGVGAEPGGAARDGAGAARGRGNLSRSG